MDHQVLGIEEAVVVKMRKPTPKREDPDDVLFGNDPFDFEGGRERLAASKFKKGANYPQAADAAHDVANDSVFGESDAEVFEGLHDDILDALAEDLTCVEERVAESVDDISVAVVDEEVAVSDGSEGFDAIDEVALAEAERVLTPTEAMAHTIITPSGYVECSAPPWNERRCIGRITTWGKKTENIQASCNVHSKCRTPAKIAATCSRKHLMLWLLSGAFEPGAPTKRRQHLGECHKDMFNDILKLDLGAVTVGTDGDGDVAVETDGDARVDSSAVASSVLGTQGEEPSDPEVGKYTKFSVGGASSSSAAP
jgi:hypothetical protein